MARILASRLSYSDISSVTLHSSLVHTLVNAIGTKRRTVGCPRFSDKVMCLGPSSPRVVSLKSGAVSPTASIFNFLVVVVKVVNYTKLNLY